MIFTQFYDFKYSLPMLSLPWIEAVIINNNLF